jgi:hypothetical protein
MIQTGFINNLTYMTTVCISTAQTNDTDVVMYVRLLINPVCLISLCYRYTYRSHVCQVVNTPSLYHLYLQHKLMIQTGFINNLTYMTTVGISIAQTNDTDWVY